MALVIAIGGYLVWRRSRRRPAWSGPDASQTWEHSFSSFVSSQIPRSGRRGYVVNGPGAASHPPLMSHHRPTSSLVAEPWTPRFPAPIYTPHRQTHGQTGESPEDVSIIGSSLSSPSDMTSISALMPTSPSTYLPSYASSISTPPSYATKATSGGSCRSPNATLNNTNSSWQ